MDEPHRDLSDYLLKKGYISREQYEQARLAKLLTGSNYEWIFLEMGISLSAIYQAIAQELRVPFVDLTVYKPDPAAINVVPEHIAKRHNVLPIKKDNNVLYVAMGDTNNVTAADDLRLVSRCVVRGVLAVPEHIEKAISRCYGEEHGC